MSINISGTIALNSTTNVINGTVVTLYINDVASSPTTTTASGAYTFTGKTVSINDIIKVSVSDTNYTGYVTQTIVSTSANITGLNFTAKKAGIAYCLNLKNSTWTKFDNFPAGIPINMKYLGVDLHIEDRMFYKIFDGYNDAGTQYDLAVTTGRHSTPTTSNFKSFNEADLYTDGTAGVSYTYPQTQVVLDGTAVVDTNTKVYPGGYETRQKIYSILNQCKNYALRILARVSESNVLPHAIESITWKINERSGVR